MVFISDLVLLNGAFIGTSLFKFGTIYPTSGFGPLYLTFQIFLNLVFPVCLVLAGAYRDIARTPIGQQAVTSLKACIWASALTLATQTMLSTLGLWQSIESHAQTVNDIIVTDGDDSAARVV